MEKKDLELIKEKRKQAQKLNFRVRYVVGIPNAQIVPGKRPPRVIWKAFLDMVDQSGNILFQNSIPVQFDNNLSYSKGWAELIEEIRKSPVIQPPKPREGYIYHSVVVS